MLTKIIKKKKWSTPITCFQFNWIFFFNVNGSWFLTYVPVFRHIVLNISQFSLRSFWQLSFAIMIFIHSDPAVNIQPNSSENKNRMPISIIWSDFVASIVTRQLSFIIYLSILCSCWASLRSLLSPFWFWLVPHFSYLCAIWMPYDSFTVHFISLRIKTLALIRLSICLRWLWTLEN